MIALNNLTFEIDFTVAGTDEILQNIRTLVTTPVGAVPFDRNFGVDLAVLDFPFEQAKHLLTVEYIEKIRSYEPRARVKAVQFEHDAQSGTIYPKVVLEFD